MKTQPLTAVKIGNHRTPKTVDVTESGSRPAAQHKAVLDWHREHPSAFWTGNAFEFGDDGQSFHCSFAHTYVSPSGHLESIWVTPTGRIKQYVVVGGVTLPATETIARYGVFNGGEVR